MEGNDNKKSFFPTDKDLLFRIGVGAAAVLLLIGIVALAMHLVNSKVDTTEGRSLLNKLNSAPVSTIKAEIKELEKSEAEIIDKKKKAAPAQRFADTVIMGDGSIQGLTEYCNLTRVLSVQTAEVSGVEKEACASLEVQSKKDSPSVQARPAAKPSSSETSASEEEEVVEDGIHNNYGIEGNTNEEKVYAGDPLKLDTTYGNPGGSIDGESYQDPYGYEDPYAYEEPAGYYDPETGEFIYEEASDPESQEPVADKTINSQMITAIKANPSKLFLAYGYNDLTTTKGLASPFIESYKTVLESLQEKLPDCDIYVLSILAPRKDVQGEKKEFESREEFNEELAALCRVMHVTFIDNEELVNSSDYSEDGVTFTESFYTRLLERLEEIGDL
ncbi:MAG: hypothetical protein MJ097_04250 [Dorea sp.]|nr:hypothetical protein [Dorea sp.]